MANGSNDTDSDSLTDSEEFALGTNPTRDDTDYDGIVDSLDADPLNPETTPPVITLTSPGAIALG